jgi:hypothetical protein
MPERIGTVLMRLLKRYDMLGEVEKERIVAEWKTLSKNQIFTFCYPAFVKGSILYLKTKDACWYHALTGKEKEMYQIITRAISLKHITKIVFIS